MAQATADGDARQQRRVIRAWCMYDWANSGYATSGVAAIFPVYFVALFQDALGESASFFGLTFTGSSMWSFGIALATVIVALSSPVLGVMADRAAIKKTLLGIYTATGAGFTVLMFLSAYTGQPWLWFLAMFILANIGFAGCLVFYNSLLPHIAPRAELDTVSSKGFTYGYIGGGLLLAVQLAAILYFSDTYYADLATRIAIASIGVWWFGWAVWTLKGVPEPVIPEEMRWAGRRPGAAVKAAFGELAHTFKELRAFRVVIIYLIAYVLFNDGIQTVLAIAGAFAADTLQIPATFIILTILIIQFVAAGGAMAFAWLAGRIGTKTALMGTLLGWIFIVLFGVAVVALVPDQHSEFDYQLTYQAATGDYRVDAAPDLGDSELQKGWREELAGLGLAEAADGDSIAAADAGELAALTGRSDQALYGVSIAGGPWDGERVVGARHPSTLGRGPVVWWPASGQAPMDWWSELVRSLVNWWPELVRSLVWAPLGLDAPYQWLLLGVGVGLVMGGSQALARSLFAQIAPQSRSGEFFAFFAFMSRLSSVIGPILYVVATDVFDTRVAVVSILLLIVAGAIVLRWVDVAAGAATAQAEDARRYRSQG